VFTESAELYDLIYGGFKDYRAESAQVAGLLRSIQAGCRTVLDVGCGTGEHAHLLAEVHGFEVDGLDLSPDFLRIARAKHPAGRFYQADMSRFQLPQRYDAVLCLFSSIGYLKTLDRVAQALGCFRRHLAPEGVVVVEPWFPPGKMQSGVHSERLGEGAGVKVRRVGTTEVDGRVSRVRFDYIIETRDGVRQATEIHELGLFTVDEMLAAFGEAGLSAEHEPEALTGRGLYVARIPGGPSRPTS
jgi:SAM-dependent methyltransferase